MNKTLHRIYIYSLFTIGAAVTLLLGINGFTYYLTPVEERFFSEAHQSLKPSGAAGHGFGIAGTLMMVAGVSIYMVRKRTRALFNFGYLKHWLEFHIFLCSVGPILVLYHTAFKFGGIVSVSFWSMVLVVLSGIAGRFIYVQIPRTIQGKEISIRELEQQNEELHGKLIGEYGIEASLLAGFDHSSRKELFKPASSFSAFFLVIKDYFEIKKQLKFFGRELQLKKLPPHTRKEAYRAAKQQLILSRRINTLQLMQKLFKYWHVAHLPFAFIMFFIMIIHVAVTIAFGYKWIF